MCVWSAKENNRNQPMLCPFLGGSYLTKNSCDIVHNQQRPPYNKMLMNHSIHLISKSNMCYFYKNAWCQYLVKGVKGHVILRYFVALNQCVTCV